MRDIVFIYHLISNKLLPNIPQEALYMFAHMLIWAMPSFADTGTKCERVNFRNIHLFWQRGDTFRLVAPPRRVMWIYLKYPTKSKLFGNNLCHIDEILEIFPLKTCSFCPSGIAISSRKLFMVSLWQTFCSKIEFYYLF